MLNPGNRIVVWYPEHGLRVRSCQTTVYPPGLERRDIIDPKKRVASFNKWADYIKSEIVAMSGAGQAHLNEAKRILNKVTVK